MDEEKAFEYINKTYEIQSEFLPRNHPDFAQTYKNFGDLYIKKGNSEQALFYYHQLLETRLKTLQWNHSSVAMTYCTIGLVNQKDKDHEQALRYFHKILKIELSKRKHGDALLSNALKTIWNLYLETGNND